MPSTTRARGLNERGRDNIRKDLTRRVNSEYHEKGVRNRLAVGWLSSGITAQVKMALLFHRSTSAITIKVETKHGVVTLSGKAANAAEKDLVTKLVNDVNGVKNVKNQMTIG